MPCTYKTGEQVAWGYLKVWCFCNACLLQIMHFQDFCWLVLTLTFIHHHFLSPPFVGCRDRERGRGTQTERHRPISAHPIASDRRFPRHGGAGSQPRVGQDLLGSNDRGSGTESFAELHQDVTRSRERLHGYQLWFAGDSRVWHSIKVSTKCYDEKFFNGHYKSMLWKLQGF